MSSNLYRFLLDLNKYLKYPILQRIIYLYKIMKAIL